MHHFFEKSVACNEAHKNQRIQGKNKKLSKSRRVMHFWVYISKPQKVVTLKYGEKAPTLGTFKVRHRGVNKRQKLRKKNTVWFAFLVWNGFGIISK